MYGLSPDTFRTRRDRLLAVTKLAEFKTRRAEALSGGMYKKLALACALLHEPKVLLLDEPASGLDPRARIEIKELFKELKSTLGFHQYQFQKFEPVEDWVELALTAFMYLEWYRAQQMSRRDLSDEEKRWWQHQRTYGLCQAVRSASEKGDTSSTTGGAACARSIGGSARAGK